MIAKFSKNFRYAKQFCTFRASLVEPNQTDILNQYNLNPTDLNEYRKKIIYRFF